MAGRDREGDEQQQAGSNCVDPENVVRFPGDWVGPIGDLVPLRTMPGEGDERWTERLQAVEPTKLPDFVPPAPVLIDGDAFWGESSEFVQQAVVGVVDSGDDRPAATKTALAAATTAAATGAQATACARRASSDRRARRRLMKVAVAFVCLAVASFAADAGLFGSHGGEKRSSAEVTQIGSSGSGRTVKNASARRAVGTKHASVTSHRMRASKSVRAVVRESAAVQTASRPAGRGAVTEQSGQGSGSTSVSSGSSGSGVESVGGLPGAGAAAP